MFLVWSFFFALLFRGGGCLGFSVWVAICIPLFYTYFFTLLWWTWLPIAKYLVDFISLSAFLVLFCRSSLRFFFLFPSRVCTFKLFVAPFLVLSPRICLLFILQVFYFPIFAIIEFFWSFWVFLSKFRS